GDEPPSARVPRDLSARERERDRGAARQHVVGIRARRRPASGAGDRGECAARREGRREMQIQEEQEAPILAREVGPPGFPIEHQERGGGKGTVARAERDVAWPTAVELLHELGRAAAAAKLVLREVERARRRAEQDRAGRILLSLPRVILEPLFGRR